MPDDSPDKNFDQDDDDDDDLLSIDESHRSGNSTRKVAKVKEYHTNVVFNINGHIIVYSNFFFIKKLLKLVTGIAKDMEEKRSMLTANIRDPQVLDNIISGYDYLEELRKAAYKRMEDLRQEQL